MNSGRDSLQGVLVACATIAGVALCVPGLSRLFEAWQRVEYYGHGLLLPLVALYLVLTSRGELRRVLANLQPPRFGALLVFAAASFEALMVLGDVLFGAGIGIPLLLATCAYALGGPALLRPLALPLVFLALMVPLPGILMDAALVRLKLWVTEAAVWALHAAGQPVLAEGNRLHLPEQSLFVADACSGLTSIVTMMPLGAVAGYFLSHGVWRRAVVFGSILPIALAANVVRVIVTVVLVSEIGVEAAQGMLHESFGIATYAVGTVALVTVARALR